MCQDGDVRLQTNPGIPAERDFMAQYYSMVGRPQISDSFWAFLKAFILFRMSAINHGVFSRGLGGNASSTRALTMGEGKVSGWAAMCATGLELIKRAGGKL